MSPRVTSSPCWRTADLFLEPVRRVDGDKIEYSCRLEEHTGPGRRVWFQFPAGSEPLLTRRADPFVLATLVYGLGRMDALRIHGTVSDGLLANVTEFQSAFAAFHGRNVAPVQFTASAIATEATAIGAGGLTAFSGGVDSCFSVFRHTALSALGPKRPLRGALMMQGFDIPLAEPATFDRAAARARALTEAGGLRLLTGATNLREIPGQWEDTFGTAVAAALSFFQPAFAFGLIPSAQQWRQAHFDHGSNPLTDPLLSSGAFAIVHDGASHGRIDKLRELTQWPDAMRLLRVCWEGRELETNCGKCEKCLRTLLMLRLCGVADPAAFPGPLDLAALDRLVIQTRGGMDEFGYLLDEARRLRLAEPWVGRAARALRRSRRVAWIKNRGRAVVALLPGRFRVWALHERQRWLRRRADPMAPDTRHPAPHAQ